MTSHPRFRVCSLTNLHDWLTASLFQASNKVQNMYNTWTNLNCVLTVTHNVYPRDRLRLFLSSATSLWLDVYDLRHSLKKQMGYKKITWHRYPRTERGQPKMFTSLKGKSYQLIVCTFSLTSWWGHLLCCSFLQVIL